MLSVSALVKKKKIKKTNKEKKVRSIYIKQMCWHTSGINVKAVSI